MRSLLLEAEILGPKEREKVKAIREAAREGVQGQAHPGRLKFLKAGPKGIASIVDRRDTVEANVTFSLSGRRTMV